MRKEYLKLNEGNAEDAFEGEPAPGAKKTEATKPTDIKGFTVKRISK
jgi:hypothetical protein